MGKYLTLFLSLLLWSSCDSTLTSSNGEPDNFLTSVETTDTLQIELTIKSKEIERLEEVEAQFNLQNISDKEVVYRFPSGCQYGYTITKNHNTIFDSRKNLGCTAALSQLKLEPDQTKNFPISLSRFDINKKLSKGIYELNAFLLEDHAVQITTSFKVE